MPSKRGGRGGARQGTPGTAYTNRSDLNQAPRAVPNQTYGEAGAQLQSQRTIPLAGPGKSRPQPVPLNAPTARPGEPVTAGAPMGAGPGPAANMTPSGMSADDDAEGFLRAVYKAHPNSDTARLLAQFDARRR